jgi:hypothetical protein
MMEQNPSFGYRTVAYLLDFNKNTVQRIFQLMRWQLKKRPDGFRPRIKALPSLASRSYGPRPEFITPHSSEQNRMVERLIRTLKE